LAESADTSILQENSLWNDSEKASKITRKIILEEMNGKKETGENYWKNKYKTLYKLVKQKVPCLVGKPCPRNKPGL